MAKNLASGHWGIHPEEVANASSSPLYTALITVLGIAGVPWLWTPLVLNVLSAILLLGAAAQILKHFAVPINTARFALAGLVVLLPLPYIAQFGMEHTLHSALTLLFVSAAIRALNGGRIGPVLILGPLMMGIRLESAFIIGITGLSLLVLSRFQDALFLGIASSAPMLALGLINVSLGEHFLPNSILLKAGLSSGGSVWMVPLAVLQKSVLQAFAAPYFIAILVVLIAAADAALKQAREWQDPRVLWPMASALAIVGHLCFANVGWLYRYEVYLVALSVVGFAISAPRPKRWMLLVVVIPLAFRTWQCVSVLPSAILHINSQQVQMAHFVQQNFDTEAIAAHDIGAIAFFSHARILDLAGLASRNVLDRRLSGNFDTSDIRRMAVERNVKLAIIYDSWFQGEGSTRQFWIGPKLPATWVKAGEWRLRMPAVIGDQTVSFYATSLESLPDIQTSLDNYASRLPERVRYMPVTIGLQGQSGSLN